jgi:hypothetical protein
MRRDHQLFTVFLEYKGGTYISQVRGSSPSAGLSEWSGQLSEKDLMEWSLDRSQLARIVAEGDLVPLQDRVSVWCLSGVDDHDEQVLVNIVATDDEQQS